MLKQLDKLSFSRWHLYMVVALGTTWVFDGYEVSMLALVSDQLMESFDKTESQIGLIVSIYLIGLCTGSILFSCFAYKFGRKDLFNITLGVYACSVVAITFSTSYEYFVICRFFTGIGVGGEYSAIFVAIDELIPARVRGQVDISLDGTWAFGGVLASLTSIILLHTYTSNSLWRVQFLFGAIGVIPILFMRRNIPESPRWLYFKGRHEEAQQTINFIVYCSQQNKVISFDLYKQQTLDGSLNYLVENDDTENINQNQLPNMEQPTVKEFYNRMGYILFKKYPSRLFLGLVLISTQAFFYQGIYLTFTMQLKNQYKASEELMYILMMPLSIAGFLGTILFSKFFDTLGRRFMITFTYLMTGGILTLIGCLIIWIELNIYLYSSLFYILFLIAFPGTSSAHLTISEIFPSQMRSQAMGVFYAIGLAIGGIGSPFFFGRLIQTNSNITFAYGCFLAAGLMTFGGLVAFCLAIPAERKTLEEISNFDHQPAHGATYQAEDRIQQK